MPALERRRTDWHRSSAPPHPGAAGDRNEEASAHPGLPSPHILGIEDPRATNRTSFQAGAGAKLAASSPSDLAEKPFCCGSHRGHSPAAHGEEWLASCSSTPPRLYGLLRVGPRGAGLPHPLCLPVLPLGLEAPGFCLLTRETTQWGGVSHLPAIPENSGDSRPQGTQRTQQYHPQPTAQVTS